MLLWATVPGWLDAASPSSSLSATGICSHNGSCVNGPVEHTHTVTWALTQACKWAHRRVPAKPFNQTWTLHPFLAILRVATLKLGSYPRPMKTYVTHNPPWTKSRNSLRQDSAGMASPSCLSEERASTCECLDGKHCKTGQFPSPLANVNHILKVWTPSILENAYGNHIIPEQCKNRLKKVH